MVSHGVIYRQRSIGRSEAVGKRIFCSNRYQRAGCGRTVQLYGARTIPFMHYGAAHVFVFLSSLMVNLTVEAAYQRATGQSASRHAWRWLEKLTRNLTDFRCFLAVRLGQASVCFQARCRRLRLLLPTLHALCSTLPRCPGSQYQLACQRAFM